MEVIVGPDAAAVACRCAELIEQLVREKPGATLGLATGRTMEPIYGALVERVTDGGLDLSGCRFFALDDYLGIPHDDPRSFRSVLKRLFLDRAGVPAGRACFPDPLPGNLEEEAEAYEKALAQAGGIDLQLLGLGENGHVGFNEPGSPFDSRTRAVELCSRTREQNACAFGGDPSRVPRLGMTMGVGTILEARRCLLVVTGSAKAKVLAAAVEGPPTRTLPASALQHHPCCTVIADEEAAALLNDRDQYRAAFGSAGASPAATLAAGGRGR
ncbi:MAG: glucosamine-6-phosphate deaminase [Myxococcota bacterium]